MSPQTSSDPFRQVFFVESVCDDPDVIATNILVIESRFFQDFFCHMLMLDVQ